MKNCSTCKYAPTEWHDEYTPKVMMRRTEKRNWCKWVPDWFMYIAMIIVPLFFMMTKSVLIEVSPSVKYKVGKCKQDWPPHISSFVSKDTNGSYYDGNGISNYYKGIYVCPGHERNDIKDKEKQNV